MSPAGSTSPEGEGGNGDQYRHNVTALRRRTAVWSWPPRGLRNMNPQSLAHNRHHPSSPGLPLEIVDPVAIVVACEVSTCAPLMTRPATRVCSRHSRPSPSGHRLLTAAPQTSGSGEASRNSRKLDTIHNSESSARYAHARKSWHPYALKDLYYQSCTASDCTRP